MFVLVYITQEKILAFYPRESPLWVSPHYENHSLTHRQISSPRCSNCDYQLYKQFMKIDCTHSFFPILLSNHYGEFSNLRTIVLSVKIVCFTGNVSEECFKSSLDPYVSWFRSLAKEIEDGIRVRHRLHVRMGHCFVCSEVRHKILSIHIDESA